MKDLGDALRSIEECDIVRPYKILDGTSMAIDENFVEISGQNGRVFIRHKTFINLTSWALDLLKNDIDIG